MRGGRGTASGTRRMSNSGTQQIRRSIVVAGRGSLDTFATTPSKHKYNEMIYVNIINNLAQSCPWQSCRLFTKCIEQPFDEYSKNAPKILDNKTRQICSECAHMSSTHTYTLTHTHTHSHTHDGSSDADSHD